MSTHDSFSAAAATMSALIDSQFSEVRAEAGDGPATCFVIRAMAEAFADRVNAGASVANTCLLAMAAIRSSMSLAAAGMTDLALEAFDDVFSSGLSRLRLGEAQTHIGEVIAIVDDGFAKLTSLDRGLPPHEAAALLGTRAGEESARAAALDGSGIEDRIRTMTATFLASPALRAAGVVDAALSAFGQSVLAETARLSARAAGGQA